MAAALIFGNELITLDEVASTNTFTQELVASKKLMEGLVVWAKAQTSGRGQRGNIWQAEPYKNLTFSLVLTPNLLVEEQFMLSKVIALGIYDFLSFLKIENVEIKWPNDILVNGEKIAGILIENTLKQSKIGTSVVGIGLNVNQSIFPDEIKATSLKNELDVEREIKEVLSNLLIHLEKRYLQLRAHHFKQINEDYLAHLFGYQKSLVYQIEEQQKEGIIVGVSSFGKLQLQINGVVEEFGMKELRLGF
ncbi:MAG: biotin--[acetyl-CoA-carboxylase] ligase [Flavobacteriales bacterium]|nr:biotin--[acetyl-CoA-carboxylase] ligase [Flavobacteriales bacterium]